jgi:DNA helicase-2/ATP-dependent DNA helicase PcrA
MGSKMMSTHTNLDEHQHSAVTSPVGPLAIMAGPGSGKTATLVARIAHLYKGGEIDPGRSMALCHTSKAAGELRERMRRAGVGDLPCSTVHAAAWRQVRAHYEQDGVQSPAPQLLPSVFAVLRRSAESVLGRVEQTTVLDLVSEIDWARARLIAPAQYSKAAIAAGREVALPAKSVVDVWNRFTAEKSAAGLMDFADVLEAAYELTCAESHPEGRAFDSLFVDEYQDIDPAQQRLIEAWLGDSDALTVVGDIDQAIFGFKGGDSKFLSEFSNRYPTAMCVSLVDNYRSTPEVVTWVNAFATRGREPLVGRSARSGAKPRVTAADHERAEESALVAQIKRWHRDGIALNEIAVLYRYNATTARLEAALTSAGIAHHTAGSTRFFERPEIRAVLIPFGQRARKDPTADGFGLLAAVARDVSGFDLDAPPAGAGAARQRWEAVNALLALVSEQMAELAAQFVLQDLQRRAVASHDLTPGGVTLATVHAAKGLEWDAVWVAGATEGTFPSSFATTPAELTEERKVFYVALSRARCELVVSWAKRRHNNWSNKPSRFLDLLAATPDARPAATPARRAAAAKRSRRR